jgi:hypothetical protein
VHAYVTRPSSCAVKLAKVRGLGIVILALKAHFSHQSSDRARKN